ncbi:Hsp20/alpha crystallin family protein [Pseudokordiimonas caeni]|uniref:Hsp20/alpha crystallin family protein n=1 Tax=Pseudokordiimonas caeni TaxID=2997908 RepID=UPI002811D134|nr:Hsp20/alpha crystallin family protein [Pseudokordiimonas caeni]
MDEHRISVQSPQESFAHRILHDPLHRIHHEVDRLIHDYAPKVNVALPWRGGHPGKTYVRANLVEHDEAFEILADLPGVVPGEVDIRLSDDSLVIEGNRGGEPEGHMHLHECDYGAFYRAVSLPGEVEAGKITASLRDGILQVILPKSKDKKKRERVITVRGE